MAGGMYEKDEYEVMACVEAIRNGWTECPLMSHEQTLEIMRQMDEVRRQLDITYPFEQGI